MRGFLLDENLPKRWAVFLQRQPLPFTVRAIGDGVAPPLSTPDPDILDWCEKHGLILLTDNRHSMPGHLADHLLAGRSVPGILTVSRKNRMDDIELSLRLAFGASLPGEYENRIDYLTIFSA